MLNIAEHHRLFIHNPNRVEKSTGLELSSLLPLQLAVVFKMQISPFHGLVRGAVTFFTGVAVWVIRPSRWISHLLVLEPVPSQVPQVTVPYMYIFYPQISPLTAENSCTIFG